MIFISREIVLSAKGIKKEYGVRTVLDFEDFKVYEGDKIGLVGLNGAGKTTLLGVLCGDIPPDKGTVSRSKEAGYIRQFGEIIPALSGGGNTKRRIQQVTAKQDSIIFADEPTANLDAEGIRWVRSILMAASTVLLISHDRALLDDICDRIVEVKDGKLRFFAGNYSDYLAKLAEEDTQRQLAHNRYVRETEQLKNAIQVKERKAAKQKKQKKTDLRKNPSEARLGGHKRAASVKKQEHEAQVLKNRLERLQDVELPKRLPKFRINFDLTDPPRNKLVISGGDIRFMYGEKVIFDHAELAIPGGAKVAITGKNGAGKTTLLKMINNRDPQISFAPKLKVGFLRQGLENIKVERTVFENALAAAVQDRASVCSILAGLLFFGADFDKKAAVLSGGEKIRLSLAMLIASDCNCLMLDEPTNYLDIPSVEAVECMVRSYPGTVITVSHDTRFLQNTAEQILLVEGGKILAK